MRSRYSAFALGEAAYLLASWHPGTRPTELALDPEIHWTRLDILASTAGGPFDMEGTVSFRARYRVEPNGGAAPSSRRGVQEELSRFIRQDGRWFYLDGVVGTPG